MDKAKELFELFSREIEALLAQSEKNSAHQHQLSEQETVVKSKLLAAETSLNQVKAEKTTLASEKEFLAKANYELNVKKGQLDKQEQQIQEQLTQLEERKQAIREHEAALDLKIAMGADIDAKLAVLEEKEQLIEKEKAIDRERKGILDIREQAINKERERLQKIADSMKV